MDQVERGQCRQDWDEAWEKYPYRHLTGASVKVTVRDNDQAGAGNRTPPLSGPDGGGGNLSIALWAEGSGAPRFGGGRFRTTGLLDSRLMPWDPRNAP